MTFSAAETFTYCLQDLKRAIVVGETTGGGAHPVHERKVNDRFWMRLPSGRAISPVTKTDWEGVGVVPDIKVPASECLEAAVADARKRIHRD
jgi:C-terminal processing protease CtpA/Prc